MAGSAERAINMALRVMGIGEVERDFRKVGQAGEQAFDKVEKSANGADRAMSEYTARLKRVAAEARKAFDSTPGIAEARAADPSGYIDARNKAILARVATEKQRITDGLPDMTGAAAGIDGVGASLTRMLPLAVAAGSAFWALKEAAFASAEAYMAHEQALDAFHAGLAIAGNQSDATAGQIEAMAQRVVSSTQQTEESALKAAVSLARVPGITAEGLEAGLEAAARFADAMGTDVVDVAADMGTALTALANGDMKALWEATDSLGGPLQARIQDLAEAGRTAEAQQVYFEGLAQAAGDGPNGLATASDRLDKAWTRVKVNFGEAFAEPVAAGLELIATGLEKVSSWSDTTAGRWLNLVSTVGSNPISMVLAVRRIMEGPTPADTGPGMFGVVGDMVETVRNKAAAAYANSRAAFYDKKYGGGGTRKRTGGGGGGHSGKSDAEREAEKLKREAEQARKSADRVIESNDDVVASYLRRAQEAEEKVGLEGDALKAVERRQAIEAVVRRINREEIEKEVAARKAEALVAGKQFDEAAATKEATEKVDAKSAALRELANRELDAADATEAFNRRQQQAKAILEQIKTPLDHLNDDLELAIGALRKGDITADDFNRRLDQLAEGFADVAYEADKSAQAWQGFGDDVGRALVDIAMNGGSALDILQSLIRLPLERLLQQNLANPVADWIDGLTGNNRDDNVAAARAALPDAAKILGSNASVLDPAAQGAAVSLTQVQGSGMAAAQALQAVALSAGNPIDDLAFRTDAAADAMGGLVPVTGQFGSALAQALAMLSGGGGGGLGGILSTALSLGAAAFGGGLKAGSLGADANALITANPGLFASGTDRLPTGVPFWVGENGREKMIHHGNGRVEVLSNQQSHRSAPSAGGPAIVNQTINIPQRADPRMTARTVARGTQQGLARATRIGVAAPARRVGGN